MSKIIVTRGLPGSGKSTWASQQAKANPGTTILERDALRYLLTGAYYTGDQELEHRVTRLQDKLVRTSIEEGLTVIISDTHLPDRSVKKWLALGSDLSVPVEVKDFRHVSLEDCLWRNKVRGKATAKVVPEEVIMDKYNRFIKGRDLTKVVEYTPTAKKVVIEPYVQPDDGFTGPNLVIFDIDNTLAIMGDRSPYDGEKVHIDTLNEDVAEALMRYETTGAYVYIVSGRDSKYREVTEKWLSDKGVYYDALYMRPEGDNREDSIIKYELFQKHIAPLGMRVLGVYDDRHRVLRMWRELGLTTFHVNGPDNGNF